MKKNYISLLVKNQPGVLARMAEAFEYNKINIIGIASGQTENPDISRIIICPEDRQEARQHILEKIAEFDFVIKLEDLSNEDFIDRELVLIKLGITKDSVSQILQIFEVFRANVVDMGNHTISAELTAPASKIEGLIKTLEPHGIKSLCRTGTVALKIGDE